MIRPLLFCLLFVFAAHAADKQVAASSATTPPPASASAPPLRVLDASIPAAARGQSAAASMMLVNPTSATIVIRGATSPVAQLIRLQHIKKTDSGLMQMTDLPRLTLPPHTNAVLTPGATELRFLNLSAPLQGGYETPLTLIFQDGTTKTIRLHIKE
jgi:copper(I)-binding protein